jgi:hypothetical protein
VHARSRSLESPKRLPLVIGCSRCEIHEAVGGCNQGGADLAPNLRRNPEDTTTLAEIGDVARASCACPPFSSYILIYIHKSCAHKRTGTLCACKGVADVVWSPSVAGAVDALCTPGEKFAYATVHNKNGPPTNTSTERCAQRPPLATRILHLRSCRESGLMCKNYSIPVVVAGSCAMSPSTTAPSSPAFLSARHERCWTVSKYGFHLEPFDGAGPTLPASKRPRANKRVLRPCATLHPPLQQPRKANMTKCLAHFCPET